MKLKKLFVSLLAVATAAVACDELNNLNETITSDVTDITFVTAEEATKTISFVAPAAWTAEVTKGAEWISLDPASGEGSTEAQTISVKVEENPDTLAREGAISITMGAASPLAIPVTQAAAGKVVVSDSWGFVGTITNWGEPSETDGTIISDIAMVADGSYYVAMGVALTAADEFKFRTNNTWGTERTTSTNPVTPDVEYEAVAGSGNIKVSTDGTYDIYLTVALDKFYVMTEGKTPAQAVEPEPVEDVWQLIGVNNNWETPIDMDQTDMSMEGEWWVAQSVEFTEGVYFKIFANNSWTDDNKNIGFTTEEQQNSGAALNVAIPVGSKTVAVANGLGDSSNIWLTEGNGGTYDVWFNVTGMEVYVMTEGYRPGETPEVTPVEPEPIDVTIKEFIAAEVSDSVLYRVSGTIVNIKEVSAAHQNATFTISDDKDELYVYRMSLADTLNRIENLGLTVGDLITVQGNRGDYNGPQMVNGCYVYHEDREAPVDYSGTYFINAAGNIAKPLPASNGYGYLYTDRAWSGAGVASVEANQFTFAAVDGGYTIQDFSGRYYYMTGSYNSFNVATELPAEGGVWTVYENESGEYIITNVLMQKYIQYSESHVSYGAYSTESGLLPTLVKAENFVPAVSLSTTSVSFDAEGGTASVEVLNADGVTVSAESDTTAFTVNVESGLIKIETCKAEAAWSFVIPVQFEYNGFLSSASITVSQSAPVVEGESITLTETEMTKQNNVGYVGTVNELLGYKLGTGSNFQTLTIAAGDYKTISFYAAGWTNGTNVIDVTNGTINGATSVTLTNSSAVNGTDVKADNFAITVGTPIQYTIAVTDSSVDVVLSIKRGCVWGFTATK